MPFRKHEKRHARPYGCTFPSCTKKFGSKNDWKRHENTQHYFVEIWKCHEKLSNSSTETCGKVAHRREVFKGHLQNTHGINESQTLETRLESCRIGRNCEARFWCGFCRETIDIKHRGPSAWAERFDHIDDHLHGRKNLAQKDINDWRSVGPDLSPKDFSSPEDDESIYCPSPPDTGSFREPNPVAPPKLDEQQPSSQPKRKRDHVAGGHVSKRSKSYHKNDGSHPDTVCVS
jgi:hypothetical protein